MKVIRLTRIGVALLGFMTLMALSPVHSARKHDIRFTISTASYNGMKAEADYPVIIEESVKKKSDIIPFAETEEGTLGVQFVISEIGAGSTAYDQFNIWFYIKKGRFWEVVAVTKNVKVSGNPAWSETFKYQPKTEDQQLEVGYRVEFL